jgi:hypothetical protein
LRCPARCPRPRSGSSQLEVGTTAALAPGTTVRLEVTAVESGRVALRLLPTGAGREPVAPDGPQPGAGRVVDRRA